MPAHIVNVPIPPQLLFFGPAPTPFDDVSVSIYPRTEHVEIEWDCDWRKKPSRIELCLPGLEPASEEPSDTSFTLAREGVL